MGISRVCGGHQYTVVFLQVSTYTLFRPSKVLIYDGFPRIVSNKYPISALEWDVIGKHLLIGDIAGHCQIWSQKDSLISDWHQLYAAHFAGEHIVQAAFFHNGMKMSLVTDKKDVTSYIDKFQRVNFTPSVVQFGYDRSGCAPSVFAFG